MKTLFLAFALVASAVSFAGEKTSVFPQVYNYGYSVQVSIWNSTDRSVTCSGPVFLSYESGYRDSDYFFGSVFPRYTLHRTIFPRRGNDRIISASHGIGCF